MQYIKSGLYALIAIIFTWQTQALEIVRHNKIDSAKESYQLGVLKLALSYAAQPYEFQERSNYLTQTKLLNELDANRVDVAWVGTSKAYEERFLPVRVPLFKGLLGHRIFLIREGEQQKFDGITELTQLEGLKAGQGASWSDTKILKNAGLSVVTTAKYQNLFHMLDGSRFDYFPRSVYSPWAEMEKHPDLPFEVEKQLMVVYPLPAYIFVNRDNLALHKAIVDGLYKAIEDGSFDKYFFNHQMIKQGLERSDIKNRRVFELINPELSEDTPLDDKRLWFNVKSYDA
ncbi:diguanylate cyclase [Saccharobesus litoralis]|uniref:Diguanylate cyclase n=1 Tax=Saccharobesus litoralis TaxID=2172099 RepID=A0A2S0VW86_9ALTE|nr:transporter substrate-binding domain-containing protein [Saccharobesus litoralis]AWB68370.1 diguanylate cyclase [Saccharobesus litoralis]